MFRFAYLLAVGFNSGVIIGAGFRLFINSNVPLGLDTLALAFAVNGILFFLMGMNNPGLDDV